MSKSPLRLDAYQSADKRRNRIKGIRGFSNSVFVENIEKLLDRVTHPHSHPAPVNLNRSIIVCLVRINHGPTKLERYIWRMGFTVIRRCSTAYTGHAWAALALRCGVKVRNSQARKIITIIIITTTARCGGNWQR